MKEPWEWDEDGLDLLIHNKVKENLSLEYKECDALLPPTSDKVKNEVVKDVSAFANSTDSIQRRIDGVRINQVELNKTQPGKVLYVVYIPQSFRAPHMAYDHKFYRRFNFQSVPMEEYEVRDVAQRGQVPDLRLKFSFSGGVHVPLVFEDKQSSSNFVKIMYSNNVQLLPLLFNLSPVPAEYIVADIYIDSRVKISNSEGYGRNDKIDFLGQSVSMLRYNWSKENNLQGKLPLWEGVHFPLHTSPIQVKFTNEPEEYMLGRMLYSPRMLPKRGCFQLFSTGSSVSIIEKIIVEDVVNL
ncbi:MAG: ATP-binding protein [Deltaproteobacteria bacterium]|nr:ATP-binding protein [Deltaproteobacteria bacterium]